MKARTRVTLTGLAALLLMLALFGRQGFYAPRLELMLLDWRFRVRGVEQPVAPIAIAAIDKRSVDAYGRWPWRRSIQAALLDRLTEAGAAVIGVDVVYSEPEFAPDAEVLVEARAALRRTGAGASAIAALDRAVAAADTDRALAEAMARSGRIALGFFFRWPFEVEGEAAITADELAERLTLVRKAKVQAARLGDKNRAHVIDCADVEPNLARFQDAASRLGFFSTDLDSDGVVRRAPLVAQCGGQLYTSLDLAVLQTLVGGPVQVVADGPDEQLLVRIGESIFPADAGGDILIDYRGPTFTFPHYSIVDILNGDVPTEQLAGHIVLVGPTEVGIQDIYPTPFTEAMPGIEIHANVIDNLVSGDVLRRDNEFLAAAVAAILICGFLLLFAIPRLGAARGAVLALALIAGVVAAAVWLFAARGWWIPLAVPVATIAATYLVLAITQSMTVEAQGRRVRRQFATYVSPQVAEEMIQHPDRFRLGGERRDLSILFSDVADFTTISEELGPEKVVELMNAYLNRMTRIVLESRGTLDKYIGDAVMAFWNAPLEVPDHPLRACEAALAMQEEILALQRERPDLAGVDRLRVRIGIHADEVSVGNMGSEQRFDYTLTGDGVNTCARLEGLNKYYGTLVMASGEMVKRLPDDFLVRPLDEIRVKGKTRGVRVVEILGRRAASDAERRWLDAYAHGLAAYQEGKWDEAERAFAAADRDRGGDAASQLLLERVATLRSAPPERWEGVWTFQTK